MSEIKNNISNVLSGSRSDELSNRETLFGLFEESPIPESELLSNLGLYIKRQDLSRILLINELYKAQLTVHGSIFEFGVRWGQNIALMESLRGLYEPYNYNRKIVGFDTFEGFRSLDQKDGENSIMIEGSYDVVPRYEEYLDKVLKCLENENPISHIATTKLIKGDATVTVPEYLQANPETILSMVYFDFDIYKPTKVCLEAIRPHLTKGSIVAFDELNVHEFPGETIALREVFGLEKCEVRRSPFGVLQAYMVYE